MAHSSSLRTILSNGCSLTQAFAKSPCYFPGASTNPPGRTLTALNQMLAVMGTVAWALLFVCFFTRPVQAQTLLDFVTREAGGLAQKKLAYRAVKPVIDQLMDMDKHPVSTRFSDVSCKTLPPAAVHFDQYVALETMPRTGEGGYFLVDTGAYQLDAQSFCLQAGTTGPTPSSGDGYLPASLKGPKADLVLQMLQRAPFHPEIPQRNIQSLLWAIIAQVDYQHMPREMQTTAAALLTKEKLFELKGGPLSLLPDKYRTALQRQLDACIQQLAAPLQRIARAQLQLREQITQAATYEALESLAVLTGAVPQEAAVREVAKGEWAQTRQGYFLRYLPSGYARTTVQVYVPDSLRAKAVAGRLSLNVAQELATPASTGSQRLALTGRTRDGDPPPMVMSPRCASAWAVAQRVPPEQRAAMMAEYLKLLDALDALAQTRELFVGNLDNPDWTAIFGVLYYHVLDQTARRVHDGKATNVHELQLVNRFYDAWAANLAAYTQARNVDAVEPHWRPYFKLATSINASDATVWMQDQFANIIKYAVSAHIDGDLPRAIRDVHTALPDAKAKAELAVAFQSTEVIFDPAQSAFFRDMGNFFGKEGQIEELIAIKILESGKWIKDNEKMINEMMDEIMENETLKRVPGREKLRKLLEDMPDPKKMRNEAWAKAISRERLITSNPQPKERTPSSVCPGTPTQQR